MAVLRGRLQGFVEQGGKVAILAGFNSSNKVQQSFPSTTVSVYVTGTITLATIFSDTAGTLKANPFTADTNGYWYCYADEGRYDITFSGTGISTPFSLSDVPSVFASSTALVTYNVKDYGAVGDGVTDDRSAISACIAAAALSSTASEVFFPPGSYDVTTANLSLNSRSNLRFRGAGTGATRIFSSRTDGRVIFTCGLSVWAQNITISDMTLGPNGLSGIAINLTGKNITDVVLENVEFVDISSIQSDGVDSLVVRDCIFQGKGKCLYTAINVVNGGHKIRILNNDFFYWANGILLNTTSGNATLDVGENALVEGNYFDGGFWTMPAAYSNSGGTVSYTGTTLTDTAANFTGIVAGTYIRLMQVTVANVGGTVTTQGQKLADTAINFTAAGARRGSVVIMGGAFAIVTGVENNNNTLDLDGWLSNTDRTPVATPASGGLYILYDIYLGKVTSVVNPAQLQVTRWYRGDDGATVLAPLAGTRYEIGALFGEHFIQAGASWRDVRIVDNTTKRAYGDQIAVWGTDILVSDNHVFNSQDMGITAQQCKRARITGNSIERAGANCISAVQGSHYVIADNTCTDSAIALTSALVADGATAIRVEDCVATNVHDNTLVRVNAANMQMGVLVLSVAASTTDNNVHDNVGVSLLSTTPFVASGVSCDRTYFNNNKLVSGAGGAKVAAYANGATNTRTNLTATATWDPPNVNNNASTSTTISIQGAVAGTQAVASLSTLAAGWQITAIGTAVDTVTITITNSTGGAVDLPSGTLTVTLLQA